MWLTLLSFPPPLPPVPSLPPDPQRSHHAQAVFDFTPHHPSQLRFLRGDVIELIDCSDSVRWRGRCHGRVGYFPPEYVQPIYHCQWPDFVSNKRTAIPSGSPTSHPERHSRCSPALHSPVNFLEQTTELPPNDPFPKLTPPPPCDVALQISLCYRLIWSSDPEDSTFSSDPDMDLYTVENSHIYSKSYIFPVIIIYYSLPALVRPK